MSGPSYRVLVVEDDPQLAAGLAENLRAEGFNVDTEHDGNRAVEWFEGSSCDLIVLDVMLPGRDGFEVCRALRAAGTMIPVLFLTARGDPADRVRGLEAGGDDYLAKPFHLEEFLLRVRAILRRWDWYKASTAPAAAATLRFGGNEVDFHAFRGTSWNGEVQELTEKEAMILKVLAEKPGEIVSREDLLERVWGYDVFPSTRTVDNFILRLRKRFERDPANPRHFLTVWGVGYRFSVEGEAAATGGASSGGPGAGRAVTSGARTLKIGTRGSELALWQARRVAELLGAQPGVPAVELVRIRTEGDARTDVPLWQVGGQAFFTREIDRAVLAGEVDAAVHSLKDLGTVLDEGLALTAVLEREDPRDALLVRAVGGAAAGGAAGRAGANRSGAGAAAGREGAAAAAAESPLAQLPAGARVGTSSLRRRAFLARARRDLQLLELRGNVPTRIERLAEGRFDAIVLAAAGVKRLGLERHITAYLPCREFTPAVSQGAIGVVCRETDVETARWLSALDDVPTRIETLAERALLRRVEGGCQVPLGAVGRLRGGRMTLFACVCAGDGSESIEAEGAIEVGGPARDDVRDDAPERAVRLGEQLADELLAKGAGRIIAHQRAPATVEPP